MKATAIVPSAGDGKRMQTRIKKPYLTLKDRPLLCYALEILDRVPAIEKIIVPVGPEEEDRCRTSVLGRLSMNTPVTVISGGKTRQASVRNALDHVSTSSAFVLIHDGARPFITLEMVETSLREASEKLAVTFGVPVKDTITMVSRDDRRILKPLDRNSLYRIQTPQTFDREIIIDAHKKAFQDGFEGTDDASLVERLGFPVTVISGRYRNIKITTLEDLAVAEAFLQKNSQPLESRQK